MKMLTSTALKEMLDRMRKEKKGLLGLGNEANGEGWKMQRNRRFVSAESLACAYEKLQSQTSAFGLAAPKLSNDGHYMLSNTVSEQFKSSSMIFFQNNN